ncbi:hypothetical protein BKA82DRAFT_1006006 [Pisolithus tinctorius]|uniref:Uncharacterized protein n=1 Tax=Pisolithus tinctorius Marx 270 TaxID=870435 RepID=A0A0C3N953_PISTI|nr:hypothetical protein BKA82DRAFT_1006006 [Pisolithus tinctorius]KIN97604.1 hypothetical protein M404DRAFT_1006006 [Pisolithus tinctorius Marx 270]
MGESTQPSDPFFRISHIGLGIYGLRNLDLNDVYCGAGKKWGSAPAIHLPTELSDSCGIMINRPAAQIRTVSSEGLGAVAQKPKNMSAPQKARAGNIHSSAYSVW